MKNMIIHNRSIGVFTETALQNMMFEAFRKLGEHGLDVVDNHPYVETEHDLDGTAVNVRFIKGLHNDYFVTVNVGTTVFAGSFMDKSDL